MEQSYQEGNLKIVEAGGGDAEGVLVLRAGDQVKFTIPVYASHFFGDYAIVANAEIENFTKKKVKAIYYVSFHTSDGQMIGCHQGTWDLNTKATIKYGSAIIFSDPQLVRSVRKYKLRVIVAESN